MKLFLFTVLVMLLNACAGQSKIDSQAIIVAAEHPDAYLSQLTGKRVGLLVNQMLKPGSQLPRFTENLKNLRLKCCSNSM